MKIGPKLDAKLRKTYAPDSRIDEVFLRYDITFLTDAYGDPVTLFIGKRKPDGSITGDRFTRRLLRNEEGAITRSHWDYKGRI